MKKKRKFTNTANRIQSQKEKAAKRWEYRSIQRVIWHDLPQVVTGTMTKENHPATPWGMFFVYLDD